MEEARMKQVDRRTAVALLLAGGGSMLGAPAWADEYDDAIAVFRKADESGRFFKDAYGYAVFPKIAKAGVGIGGARGKGRVYEKGKHIGDSTMSQLSIGFQLGAEGFSEIVFFENEAALKKFTAGSFEFSADAQAVAITLGASAKAGTTGATAGASVTKEKAAHVAAYNNGMAVFTVIRGGLMYEVSIAGQKYKYEALAQHKKS
jgi:lipid-binding SYLF domain-containing protein